MHWVNIFWLITCIRLTCGEIVVPPTDSLDTDWWQHSVIYEIFPLSFKDSNGDGSGDFKGVAEKLDYIADLGVTAIWLTPFAESPLKSGGYDVSDYLKIQKVFGTMDDFKDLVYKAHKKNLKVIMDFVPNHTSDQHVWFENSVNNNNKYANYYIWQDAKNQAEVMINSSITPEVPNNWRRIYGTDTDGSAWYWNNKRKQFYFTQFIGNLPDLNYHNEDVHIEMENVLNYWLNLGVDGIRIDALKHVYENENLIDEPVIDPSKPINYGNLYHIYTVDQDEIYSLINKWHSVLNKFSERDNNSRIIITESYSANDILFKYYTSGAEIPSNFKLMDTTQIPNNTVNDFDRELRNWLTKMPKGATYNSVFQNHDRPRVPTLYGAELVDGINAFLFFLPGVAIVYYGQELGMENIPTPEDNSRSPMQWDNTKYAGFTNENNTKGPWIQVHQDYVTRNVQNESSDPKSYLNFFKSVVKLRQTETLKRGGLATYIFNDKVYVLNRFLPGFNNYTLIINTDSKYSQNVRISDHIPHLQDPLIVVLGSENSKIDPGKFISVTESLVLNPGATIILTEYTSTTTSSPGVQLNTSFIVLLPIICLQFLINYIYIL